MARLPVFYNSRVFTLIGRGYFNLFLMASPFPPLETRMNRHFISGGFLLSPVELWKKKKNQKPRMRKIFVCLFLCFFVLNSNHKQYLSISHHSTELIRAIGILASVIKKFLQVLRYYKNPVPLLFSFFVFCLETTCRNVCWWQSWRKTMN